MLLVAFLKYLPNNPYKTLRIFVDFFYRTDFIVNNNPYSSPAYEEAFRRSIECPEEFWSEIAQCVEWTKPWTKVLDNTNEPFTKW